MDHKLPDWVRHAVFYQIFPDRFRRDAAPWPENAHLCSGRKPCNGNLRGILHSIPYLERLGITALYLTPIFHAGSYHKYDTIDYYTIDPCFGDNETFGRLVNELHKRDIRIVLDGVFNHCSDRHPFFEDAMKNGLGSAHWDWFNIRGDRVVRGTNANYARWAGVETMPEWNHENPAVAEYLLSVVRHWIAEYGIDGWRLDTTEYLPPDFVRAIYDTARAAGPDTYVLGEVMGLGTPWFRHHALDGVMHYKLWEGLVAFLAQEIWDARTFAWSVYSHWHSYPEDANYGSYTLLSSHDKPRFLTQCHGDIRRLRLAFALQFTFPGSPAIYYGDEIGLEGGDDPDNRRCFPWNESLWNQELFAEVQSLVRLRRTHVALRTGSVGLVKARDRFLVFHRTLDADRFLIAINASPDREETFAPSDGSWIDALTNQKAERALCLPPLSYRILRQVSD